MNFAFSRFVDFWRTLHRGELDVLAKERLIDVFRIEYKLYQVRHRFNWPLDNVFITNKVNWDFRFQPEVMEVFPNCYLLLYEIIPGFAKSEKVLISNRQVVRARTNHIEQTGYTVERASDKEDRALRAKLSLPISLWVVSLNNPHALVDKSFSCEAQVHKCAIQFLRYVAVRSSH